MGTPCWVFKSNTEYTRAGPTECFDPCQHLAGPQLDMLHRSWNIFKSTDKHTELVFQEEKKQQFHDFSFILLDFYNLCFL